MNWELEVFRVKEQKAALHPIKAPAELDEDLTRRLAARRFYREAPPYCIRFEDNGAVTLRQKSYEYWENREPEKATTWIVISTHDDIEEAERRLRLICSASVYYDAEDRPAKPPGRSKPRWEMPPSDDE